MKKIIILILVIFELNIFEAQTPANTGGIQAPEIIKEKFIKQHPAVTPNWSKEGDNYRATYIDDISQREVLIIYDKNGTVIRTESELDNVEYPKPINEYYNKNYPNEKFKIWSAQDKTGVKNYYINRDNKVIWFDKDGNYVPENKGKNPQK